MFVGDFDASSFKTSHKKRMKMEKTPRYTQRERNMVLGYAAQYKDVIENKRTDAESNRKKDEVWRQIAKEFNARVYHQRSAKQLRQLYKNMKLLLKKDLCGEGKGNRSFMDLLNTLSQQESVAQYISEQMSPSGYSSSRQQKYDDDYDDSKLPSVGACEGMDTDVIVIKSEDLSDNEQSRHPPTDDMDDDDDDDCLSPKDIPEVCLEEEDDEIFATDLRHQANALLTPAQRQHLQLLNVQQQSQTQSQQQQSQSNSNSTAAAATQQQTTQQQQSGAAPPPPPAEITIHNVGGIRVGSIGSLANLKALQNGNNSALSITHSNSNNSSSASNHNNSASSGTNNGSSSLLNGSGPSSGGMLRQLTPAEQAQQQLLLNGLGLSAVHQTEPTPPPPPLPTLQRASGLSLLNGGIGGVVNSSLAANQLMLSLSGNVFGPHRSNSSTPNLGNGSGGGGHAHGGGRAHGGHGGSNNHGNSTGSNNNNQQHNDYMMSLAIEERKRKIDLLNAQIDYWKTLTKKLDANAGHNPTPACLCHFPGKVNGLQSQTSSS